MYKLVKAKKKQDKSGFDYIFKDFDTFYDVANSLIVPLIGRYSICVECDNANQIAEFIQHEEEYAALMVSIFASEATIEYLSMYDTNISVEDNISYFDMFKELLSSKSILIDKKALNVLYTSIDHSYDEMSKVVEILYEKFGSNNFIDERMLSKLFVLNKVVFPRQVLIAYLRQDRWREVKLKTCLSDMGNDIVLGALVKNIEALFNAKVTYFKTGKANNLVKSLSTSNINLMYRVLVVERKGLNDVHLLLDLYERGLSNYDIV